MLWAVEVNLKSMNSYMPNCLPALVGLQKLPSYPFPNTFFCHFDLLNLICCMQTSLSSRGGYREGRPGAAAPPCVLA